ncbi:hypothetical protein [Phascolarctobacterium succinatutens]|uniref:hypothetical protein n=1 Tax=Phascolarctobacterium succinatutens TaxID=626940 RepID=UPI0026EE928A|nr:hypothetical protein [Phascolarctobacterium succinatutens]
MAAVVVTLYRGALSMAASCAELLSFSVNVLHYNKYIAINKAESEKIMNFSGKREKVLQCYRGKGK